MTATALLLAVPLVLAALPPAPSPEAFEAEWRAWHQQRMAGLQKPQGWLALVGLHWLKEGENRVEGLPGVFQVAGGTVRLRAAPGDGWTSGGQPFTGGELASDAGGKATRVAVGTKTAQVIDRGGKLALRVWDAGSPARTGFTGVEAFPVDLRWRVVARWEAYPEPRKVQVPSAVGIPTTEQAPGRAWFTVDGKEVSLEPTLEDDGGLFFVFKDKTAPGETYGAGRFLGAAAPKDGVVLLDFNRAYNPPCAFSAYATCPLPLPQNVLPVRIPAGEKKYGH
jgi:uncharacterized protein (DUF1684 family)